MALTDIQIAQAASLQPILPLAQERLDIPASALEPYGHFKAKIDLGWLDRHDGPRGKLVLVTAISPTPAGRQAAILPQRGSRARGLRHAYAGAPERRSM